MKDQNNDNSQNFLAIIQIIVQLISMLAYYLSGILVIILIALGCYICFSIYFWKKRPQHKLKLVLLGLIIIAVFGTVYIYQNRAQGCVHILNKQYEQRDEFGPLIRSFEKKSGIEVTIESPNPEDYMRIYQERYSGIGDFPTLFMISGHYDLDKYIQDCLDLTGEDVAKELTNDDFALKGSDGKIYGIGFIVEAFGIAVNTTLLEEAGYKISDIHSFSDLKYIVQDITARKEKLGFAAFTTGTIGRESGNYRLAQHAPTVPLFYEMQECGLDFERHLEGTYMDAFQDYVDLCLDNATTSHQEAVKRSTEDARQEFEQGKAVFHQDGSWACRDLQEGLLKNRTGEMAVIPMYMGIEGEEDQALNETCTYYWCVSRNAPEADQKASLKFLKWLVTSREGTQIVAEQMGYQMPYKMAMTPDNIFLDTLRKQLDGGYTPVKQYYNYGERTSWVNALTRTIKAYATGIGEWDEVKKAFITLW